MQWGTNSACAGKTPNPIEQAFAKLKTLRR